jgi:hypothetical protein
VESSGGSGGSGGGLDGEWRTKKWEYKMEIGEKGKCLGNREREMFVNEFFILIIKTCFKVYKL